MKIGIIGLGLIGGSMAKAVSRYTEHIVYAYDNNPESLQKALDDESVKYILNDDNIQECDIIILCLFPDAAVDFVRQKATLFKRSCIITDCCGVKEYVVKGIAPIAAEYNLCFVGGHPMAGLAKTGYENSTGELFMGASMILTPDEAILKDTIDTLTRFYKSIGFGSIMLTTPKEHDRQIAYTSQLAHVLSNAYVKSPCALKHKGYSAGSFRDLTRVAWLNEIMWTQLFLENKDALSQELGGLIDRLQEVKNALDDENRDELRELLKQGREQKERVDRL